jgi:fatty-acyl-CoA synthase
MARPGTELLVPGLLERSVRSGPDRVALAFAEAEVTYADLDRRIDAWAATLARHGVGRGDHVALVLHNGLAFVEALFGCLRLGAVAVPVSFRLTAGEIAYILDDCHGVGAISGGALNAVTAEALRAAETASFHITEATALADPSGAPATLPIDERDTALLLYTSGTTGRPKGAMLSHRALVLTTVTWIAEMQATQDDVWLSGQPLFHIGGINGLLPFLTLGAKAVITPSAGFEPEPAIELLARHGATMCIFVPTQWDDICGRAAGAAFDVERLRVAMWSASPATRETLTAMAEAFPRASIVSAYGQTEMAGATTLLKGEDALRKMGSVGKPMLGIDLRIVDDDGRELPPGEVGEVVYRAPSVMTGYHGRPEATAEAFAGAWFHSGDLARFDEDGYLWLVDRKKDMIISGGENIYPAEVERVLQEHPGVRDVAVVGVAHARWGETPLAVVVAADPAAPPTLDDLRDRCGASLASFKRPTGLVLVDELPRNASGKVLKRQLREAYADHLTSLPTPALSTALRAPASPRP